MLVIWGEHCTWLVYLGLSPMKTISSSVLCINEYSILNSFPAESKPASVLDVRDKNPAQAWFPPDIGRCILSCSDSSLVDVVRLS